MTVRQAPVPVRFTRTGTGSAQQTHGNSEQYEKPRQGGARCHAKASPEVI